MTEDRLLVTLEEGHARPPRKWWVRLGRGLLCFAVFTVVMVAAARVIGNIHRFGGIVELEEKFAWWEQHADEYDTLFLGTSRVYRGLMPRIFDERMAESGMPAKAFNFGIDGMFAPEDTFVLERLLARKPKNLRRVFIELGMFQTNLEDLDPFSIRSAYWHDWERTYLVLKNLLESKNGDIRWNLLFFGSERERDRLRKAIGHTGAFLSQTLSVGHGTRLINAGFDPLAKTESMALLGPARDGFVAMAPDKVLSGADREAYDAFLEKLVRKEQRTQRVNRQLQRNLESIVQVVRHAGAIPIFIISPVLNRDFRYPASSLDVPVMNFSDVRAFRELLNSKHRADSAHLTAKGAVFYSEEFSRHFIEILRSQSPPR